MQSSAQPGIMQSLAQPGIMQSLADFEPEPEGAGGRAQQRGSRWGPREVELLAKTVSFLLSKHFLRKCYNLVPINFERLIIFLHFRKLPIIVIMRESETQIVEFSLFKLKQKRNRCNFCKIFEFSSLPRFFPCKFPSF
jgi:hypothetical protein